MDGGASPDPILAIVHNNRSYHMEVMHTLRMADRRSRDTSRIHIGTDITNPTSITPVWRNPWRLWPGPDQQSQRSGPAIKRAIDVVKRGEPALIDVVSQPR